MDTGDHEATIIEQLRAFKLSTSDQVRRINITENSRTHLDREYTSATGTCKDDAASVMGARTMPSECNLSAATRAYLPPHPDTSAFWPRVRYSPDTYAQGHSRW